MSLFEQGARVWVKVDDQWTPGVAGANDGVQTTFNTDNGEAVPLANDVIGPENVMNMHQTSQEGLEDMAKLADLHTGAILYNIRLRFEQDQIYTYIGSILSAVNPYKRLPLYDEETLLSYKEKTIGERPPHIFAIANEAYYAMWKTSKPQVVLISGESGAGKTESTKFILRYLSNLSNANAAGDNKKSFEEQILQSSPILEQFGNAKTVYNNNSSRFGKFMKVNFSSGGVIESGKIIDYLLEKNRVVRQNQNERNFHVFYSFLVGDKAKEYKLTGNANDYHYTNQSGVITDPTIDDNKDWADMVEAFGVMGFSDQQQSDVYGVVAGILHLGNISFIQAGGAQVGDQTVSTNAGDLIGIEESALSESLTQQTRVLRGEVIQTPLDISQASDSRDSVAMVLYNQLFKWIISKINVSLKGAETFQNVGVLDIFGFENFAVNSFEQFNINYANEKLQQYFNRHIFSLEQLEYQREGINWSEIEWVDNGECLDLIERKLGVLSLIDEESRFPKGTDESMLGKLHSAHGTNDFYVRPRLANNKFGIRHYAGEVLYDSDGFLDKNRDALREDILGLLKESSNDFVYDLFEHYGGAAANNKSSSRKKPTVSHQFKESLSHLMQNLGAASPFFVRCLKPNAQKVQGTFDDSLVLDQLRYSGMLETVRIRRAGFPVRRDFGDFLFRYRVLAVGLSKSGTDGAQCGAILTKYDADKKDWQLGNTKAFMRERLETLLEKTRAEELKVTMAKIQAVILGYNQRKRYLAIRAKVIQAQARFRAVLYRNRYTKKKRAAIKVQAIYRGYQARLLRAKLLEEKRIEEARIAEEKRLAEEARLAELARLEAEAAAAAAADAAAAAEAQRKVEEAKRQAEEEAARQAEEEAKKKQEEEEAMVAVMQKAKKLEEEHQKAEEEAARQAEEEEKRQAEEKARLEQERKVQELAARAKAEQEAADRERAQLAAFDRAEENEDAADEIEEAPMEFKESYLGMYAGVLKNIRRRWCVLHEGTFMWFKGKQDFIKAGWLTKIGGGTSTLGRKNWKKRFMALKGPELYYMPTEEENASVLGVVDVQNCKEVITEGIPFKKDNCFGIHTSKRTYFMYADTGAELQEWIDVLNKVKGKDDAEIQTLMDTAKVDPRNAVGTIDLDDILSVGPTNRTDSEGHPIFIVMTPERVYTFVAADETDMDDWVRLLTPKKRGDGGDNYAEATERGWMLKTSNKGVNTQFKRRRWFILRGDVITYYKSKTDDISVGSIPLNSLCSVIPPDEALAAQKNDWTFTVHSRHKSYQLTCKTQADCNRWINAIQDVIDNSPIIETSTEKLIDELKLASPSEVEAIYSAHKSLTFAPEPLRSSLLPLPYGETHAVAGGRTYGTLQDEALKVSTSLLPVMEPGKGTQARYGDPADPVDLIKNIIQACFDVPKLRNEVYCQVIKQTTNAPNPGSPLNMTHWHLLAALCCSFLPSRKFVRFLRFHLRRTIELGNSDSISPDVTSIASYCLEAIKRTKARDFPPSTKEVEAIMSGKGLTCSVHCVGGRVIDLGITSSTTCSEVIAQVKKELGLGQCRNGFGLFESCGSVDKYLEEKYVISDILSKWEKYEQHGINPEGGSWSLVFKLFSFYDPHATDISKTEQEFLFEQAFESVMLSRFPADDNTHIKLAALRTQFIVGDYEDGAYISDLVKVHPAQSEQLLNPGDQGGGTLKKAATVMKGTLRGFGKGTLRLLKGGTVKKGTQVSDAELQKIKSKIVDQWKTLKGLSKDDSRVKYMGVIQDWDGYGANLFEVEQTSNKTWPRELWLGISLHGVSIFPRGQRERLAFYKYETVLSFGAPVANKYKIMVDNVGSMLFETNMVLEIAKLMKEYIKEIVMRRR